MLRALIGLETGGLRLFLTAKPAIAARRAHSAARVLLRPWHEIDVPGGAALDRAAIWSGAFGILPDVSAPLLRAFAIALPDAQSGIAGARFDGVVSSEHALLCEHMTVADQFASNVDIADRA